MKKLKGYEIRQKWLDFWESKQHYIMPSASLIPNNDPTLLWINAGVAPLKKFFDGREIPINKRIANAQKSIRTNDIENVGKTARHHTFFEMLGNFSIGDYFRDEVLPWAIELLTSEEWFGLDINKLYITYYPDDIKTYELWQKCGVDKTHLIAVKDNFWEIGEGPCGPDTEIFYDRGIKYDKDNMGPKMIQDDIENDRYIEIWNIVFSQFNSKVGVKRSQYKELPSKNIDTGCGLERVACVMQEVETNYDTDLFMPIINRTEELTKTKYQGQMAFKVISDHVRSTVFALSDGATFSNEGRGYVLRRILRRAVRYGKKLGMKDAFLYKLVASCVDNMKVFYPYLVEKQEIVTKQIKIEEEKFLSTLESGEKRLLDYIKSKGENKEISKEVAFQLYDTFGFPLELTLEVAGEYGFSVDEEGFNEELTKQKERARKARTNNQSMNVQNQEMMNFKEISTFVGYDTLEQESKIIGLFKDGKQVKEANGKILVIVDKCPFYAEMGGQIGDSGKILINGEYVEVDDTIKMPNLQHALVMDSSIKLHVNDEVRCVVDEARRKAICKNHSATHLLNEALREVLGSHVYQQGSNVTDTVLRFDFNNFSNLTNEQILTIEKIVNDKINDNIEVKTLILPIDEAKKMGVQAVFGEKYGEIVRVVDMNYSKELCGGTHVKNTKEIDVFTILSIESKGSGIFRITASTSSSALLAINEQLSPILVEKDALNLKEKEILDSARDNNISLEYKKTSFPEVLPTYKTIISYRTSLEELKENVKTLDKEFGKKISEIKKIAIEDFTHQVLSYNDTKVVIAKLYNENNDNVKDAIDRLSDVLGKSVIIFANISEKVIFTVKSKNPLVNAGGIAKSAAIVTLGNGGGRPDFASAGGKDISKVDEALAKAKEEVEKILCV